MVFFTLDSQFVNPVLLLLRVPSRSRCALGPDWGPQGVSHCRNARLSCSPSSNSGTTALQAVFSREGGIELKISFMSQRRGAGPIGRKPNRVAGTPVTAPDDVSRQVGARKAPNSGTTALQAVFSREVVLS